MKKPIVVCVSAALAAGVLSGHARGDVVTLADFQDAEGAPSFDGFTWDPNGSGQSVGLTDASTSVISSAGGGLDDTYFNRLTIIDDPATDASTFPTPPAGGTAWSVRHYHPSQNSLIIGSAGYVGYYARTTASGILLSMGLDDPAGGTEGARPQSAIADGEWHLYQWNLADADDWAPMFGPSDGVIGGNATMDALFFWGAENNGATNVLDIDSLVLNAAGPIPEPATAALLGLAGLAGLARRRRPA